MKKLLCIIICLLIPLCFVGCKDSGETLSETPLASNPSSKSYEKTLELTTRTITDAHDFAIVDDSDMVWLTNDDVQDVLVIYEKGKDRYLELRFTEDGSKKFKKAVKKAKDSTLKIMLDGEVLVPSVVANAEKSEYAKADGAYEDVINWFNKLTCE